MKMNSLKFATSVLLALLFSTLEANIATANLVTKTVQEIVEQVVKKSGKTLTPAAREATERTLKEVATKHSDEVLRAVEKGGYEVMEQGAKHGDEFWHLCEMYPDSVQVLAKNADELIPLAKRIGPEVVELEAKATGTATRAVAILGDDGTRMLCKMPENASMVIGFAERTDSVATRNLFVKAFKNSHNKETFLKSFDWKVVMAGGVSTAAIISAYKISDGVQKATVLVTENNPELLPSVINGASAPFRYGFGIVVVSAFAIFTFLFRHQFRQIFNRVIGRWGSKTA